jgi:hypothetical protein
MTSMTDKYQAEEFREDQVKLFIKSLSSQADTLARFQRKISPSLLQEEKYVYL